MDLQGELGRRVGEEGIGANDRRQLRLEYLDRDPAVVADVLRQIDGGHSAHAEFALDAVAAFEGCVQAWDYIGKDRHFRGGLGSEMKVRQGLWRSDRRRCASEV